MCEQNASFLGKHSELGSKSSAENYLKSTKIAIAACQFSKNFRGNIPLGPEPLELFLFFDQLQIICAKKITLKNVKIMPPLILKLFATPLSALCQHFFKEGSKFRSKVAVKITRIVAQSFLYTFVCFLQIIYEKKRSVKFDPELSTCWKQSYRLRYQLPSH